MDAQDRDKAAQRVIDWVFLPIAIAFVVVGVGILSGLIFHDNWVLKGAMRPVIGCLLTAYGTVRAVSVARRLKRRERGESNG